MHISKKLMEHQRTKYIEIHTHFICQLTQYGVFILEYVPTKEKVEIFSKFPCHHQDFFNYG